MHSTSLVAAVLTIAVSDGTLQSLRAQDIVMPERLAQNSSVSPPGAPLSPGQPSPNVGSRSGVPNAPIGHRQPTPRDVPPEAQSRPPSEGGGSPFQIPNICTNC
jgi:hypothetical protein